MFKNNQFNLSGKLALVTGDSQNLGLEIAEALLKAGAKVIITSRKREKVTTKAMELSEKYCSEVKALELDLNKEDSICALFDIVRNDFGVLDILVNNIGGHSPEACGYEKEPLRAGKLLLSPI